MSFLWPYWERVARRAARAYIAGPHLDDALKLFRRVPPAMTATLGYWDNGQESPQEITRAYNQAIIAIKSEGRNSYISLKAPALKFDNACFEEILQCALAHDVPLHFDSHAPEEADRTFAWVEKAHSEDIPVGCSLPGRWRRSLSDAQRMLAEGIIIRVVKGQWVDPSSPDLDKRQGFLALIDRLRGHARHVRVATHDAPLAEEALKRLRKTNTSCELELLYGLPMKPALRVAQRLGVPVGVYIPYGQGWLPYCISQVYENPRIIRWVLKDMLSSPLRHFTNNPLSV